MSLFFSFWLPLFTLVDVIVPIQQLHCALFLYIGIEHTCDQICTMCLMKGQDEEKNHITSLCFVYNSRKQWDIKRQKKKWRTWIIFYVPEAKYMKRINGLIYASCILFINNVLFRNNFNRKHNSVCNSITLFFSVIRYHFHCTCFSWLDLWNWPFPS